MSRRGVPLPVHIILLAFVISAFTPLQMVSARTPAETRPVAAPVSQPQQCTSSAGHFVTDVPEARAVSVLEAAGMKSVRARGHDVVAFQGESRRAEAALRKARITTTVKPDYLRRYSVLSSSPNDPGYVSGEQWPLGPGPAGVNAPQAWALTHGSSSVTVAVIDSGVDGTHTDLAGKLVAGWDAVAGAPLDITANSDSLGHGTAVSGIIGAATDNGNHLASLGWLTSVMPIKAAEGPTLTDSAIIAGLRWATDHGAKVANLSFGGPCDDPALRAAVAEATARGVLLVAAAGNDGDGVPPGGSAPISYPAAYPGVLAVGATGFTGTRASYSSPGSYVDIAAPGGSGTPSEDIPVLAFGGTGTGAGTSFSAPMVSAGAALLLAFSPSLSPLAAGTLLTDTAIDRGPPGRDVDYGAGVLDAGGAVTARSRGQGPSLNSAPIGWLDAVTASPQSIDVVGWALDPDTTSPISVHVYVDAAAMAVPGSQSRSDVGAVYPVFGQSHGFTAHLGAGPGSHRVCAYGINDRAGANTALGCRSVTVPSGNPFGSVDSVSRAPGGLAYWGWTIDPDVASSIQVHLYLDGAFAGSVTAAGNRPDVGAAYPAYGDNHGYSGTLSVGPGTHQLCVYGINTGAGTNPLLGCRSLTVSGDPFGSLDWVTRSAPNTLSYGGWTIDPDLASSIQVHLYLDGIYAGSAAAGVNRPDVGAVYPAYGDNHGYSGTLGVAPGTHQLCVYGINTGAGTNPLLGCRSV